MAEFPALPLWTDAYLADCSHLSAEEHGWYLLILIHLWRSPEQQIPNNNEWLARKFRCSADIVESSLRPVIAEFCDCDGNWITQKRLSKEFEFLKDKSSKQSGRASLKWSVDRPRDNARKRAERMSEARKRGTHTAREWNILKQIIPMCCHCGSTDDPLEKDHIMPVYQGGSDAIENIQPSCARCNAKKGAECQDKRANVISEWVPSFESVCRKLLILHNGDVCLDGRHFLSAPTPTPISKKEREKEKEKENPKEKEISHLNGNGSTHVLAPKTAPEFDLGLATGTPIAHPNPRDQEREVEAKFDAWWKLYPRKEGKGQARKAFRPALKKTGFESLLATTRKAAAMFARGDSRFIPHPATWLNGERWLDEPTTCRQTFPDGII